MRDHLVHLAFLGANFDLLLFIVCQVSIFALLERLRHIRDAFDLDQQWFRQESSLLERHVKRGRTKQKLHNLSKLTEWSLTSSIDVL